MTRRRGGLWALLAVLTVTGCAGLPAEGPVQQGDGPAVTGAAAPFDFDPPGPVAGADPEQVVGGFLRALQATPVSTGAATEFLTEKAADDWRPDRRTVVYGAQRTDAAGDEVEVTLEDGFVLDATGRWVGSTAPGRTLRFPVVREDGEWRIDDPPDAMVIPESHFASRYREYSLYFFDPSGSVLVPEPVYLPWGPQAPTLLSAGLLAGPQGTERAVERSFFPRGTQLGVSVPIRGSGVAEVPLSPEILEVDADQLQLAVAQLVWTLRQVPEVREVSLTVDGTPLELPGGGVTAEVGGWSEYDPAVAAAATDLFGLRGDRVVRVVGDSELDAATWADAGPTRPRSLGVDLSGERFALVGGDGRSVVVLGAAQEGDQGGDQPGPRYTGSDVLRPRWDRTDRLWLVDRTADGPVMLVLDGARTRRLEVPGLDGRDVLAFALSRDGTRFAAVVDGARQPRLLLTRIVRQDGAPVRLTPAREVATPAPLTRAVAVDWRDPTTVAVLTRPDGTTSEVVLASVDGSSGRITLDSAADVLFEPGVGMAASPGGPTALVVVTDDRRLHMLAAQGRWDFDVVEPGLRAPAYAG